MHLLGISICVRVATLEKFLKPHTPIKNKLTNCFFLLFSTNREETKLNRPLSWRVGVHPNCDISRQKMLLALPIVYWKTWLIRSAALTYYVVEWFYADQLVHRKPTICVLNSIL